MTWTYKEATFIGSATNPQPGASVTVGLEQTDLVAAELATWQATRPQELFDAAHALWAKAEEGAEPTLVGTTVPQGETDAKQAELEAAHSRQFTWGFDGTQSKAQFVAMVKQEIRAHLQHLNGAAQAADASSIFDPA